ncbi:hypothetical protein FRX31_016629, partial [Thalictrum thalictroides]
MADFSIEDIPITVQLREEEQSCDPCDLLSRPEGLPIEDTPSTSMGNDVWIIHTDGSCSKTGSGIGCVIFPPNKARAFDNISISQRPRNDIRHADALAYLSSAIEMDSSRTIKVDYQKDPSINVPVKRLADMYLSACVFCFLDVKTSPPNPSVVYNMMTRKRKRDIASVAPDNVVDHDPLHISAHVPEVDPSDDSDHEGDDSPEVPDIEIVLPEDDFLDEDWRIPFIQFLKSGILPTEPPVLARVKRDAWLYTVVDTSE